MTRAHSRRSSDTMQKIQKLVGHRLLSTQRSFLRVDLRSDTVTTPSAGMLEAMRKADVGDDYYMEDPTTTILEKRMAQLCKKEAALFVPSGTMGNLVALGTHCSRGDEIIIGDKSHIFYYEGGGARYLTV